MAAAVPGDSVSAHVSSLKRITFVDVVLWAMRILIVFVVVGGTIGTLVNGRYTGEQWFDNVMFGLMIGGVYALIALGYTMVYGILRLIQLRPRRRGHVRVLHGLFPRQRAVPLGIPQCPPDPLHDHDHGDRDDRV